jgi:hypothetical protein
MDWASAKHRTTVVQLLQAHAAAQAAAGQAKESAAEGSALVVAAVAGRGGKFRYACGWEGCAHTEQSLGRRFLKCERCRVVFYCGQPCQARGTSPRAGGPSSTSRAPSHARRYDACPVRVRLTGGGGRYCGAAGAGPPAGRVPGLRRAQQTHARLGGGDAAGAADTRPSTRGRPSRRCRQARRRAFGACAGGRSHGPSPPSLTGAQGQEARTRIAQSCHVSESTAPFDSG